MRAFEHNRPDVVITAGGTSEPIDDVRYITNFSSGGLGHALAVEHAKYGGSILLLAPKLTAQKYGDIPGVEHRVFTTAEDLRQQLLGIEAAGLILQAAAVSDYTPVHRTAGKLSSDPDMMTIELKRTQKILPQLRDHFGDETTIVGFKLLSGVSEEELIATGLRQIRSAQTDYCIANDLQHLSSNQRRIHIINPDGSYQSESGTTQAVAAQIVRATSRERALA